MAQVNHSSTRLILTQLTSHDALSGQMELFQYAFALRRSVWQQVLPDPAEIVPGSKPPLRFLSIDESNKASPPTTLSAGRSASKTVMVSSTVPGPGSPAIMNPTSKDSGDQDIGDDQPSLPTSRRLRSSSQSQLIAKPKGEYGHPGSGGYSIATAVGLDIALFDEIRARLRICCYYADIWN